MGTHTKPDDVRRIMDCIRQIVQVLRRTAAAAESRVGLSGAQLFVLQQLRDGEPLSISELAIRTYTHQSSVSVVAQRLVDHKLLTRERSAKDGRKVELKITAKGLKKLSAAPEPAQQWLIAALRQFPTAPRKQLAELLEQLIANAGTGNRIPALFFEEKPSRSSRNA